MQDSEAPRELTLDEAVALAILLQKNGQLVEAQELYRRILDTSPNHADALHYAGVLAHQQGQSDRAVVLIEQSLAAAPDRADCYNNLGIVLQVDRQAGGGARGLSAGDRHRPWPCQCAQ